MVWQSVLNDVWQTSNSQTPSPIDWRVEHGILKIIDDANWYLPATSLKYLSVGVIKLKQHLKYIKQVTDLNEMPCKDCKRLWRLHSVAFSPEF